MVGSNEPKHGIVKRNEEGNQKKAATVTLLNGECFYTLYPSESNTNQLPNQMGCFEDLKQYCVF